MREDRLKNTMDTRIRMYRVNKNEFTLAYESESELIFYRTFICCDHFYLNG